MQWHLQVLRAGVAEVQRAVESRGGDKSNLGYQRELPRRGHMGDNSIMKPSEKSQIDHQVLVKGQKRY